MAAQTQQTLSVEVSEVDRTSEEVDPRVQVELERLNTATDDINKLEVDLDEARAAFRQLLCESTVRINGLAKKLGNCVERARPYYEARMKAKEALLETQHAAVKFERANSAHAAAKEMVYLAEEGLSTEGRTFDHAWQEMLNHATMRVNESERDRTLGEVEHRRTSQQYHRAEMRVQQLQKDLKRAIAKSSLNTRRSLLQINSLAYQHQLLLLPYFEMKAQFNQVLEEQKKRVKSLEQQVGQAKMSYAEALRNLEQISDEIHRARKGDNLSVSRPETLGTRRPGVGADSPLPATSSTPDTTSEANPIEPHPLLSSSSQLDTDAWSDSTGTGPPDSDSEEYLRLPDKLGPASSPTLTKGEKESHSEVSDYMSLSHLSSRRKIVKEHDSPVSRPVAELPVCSQDTLQSSSMSPRHVAIMETSFVSQQQPRPPSTPQSEASLGSPLLHKEDSDDQIWTEISLVDSPEDATSHTFVKMGQSARNVSDRDYASFSSLASSGAKIPQQSEKSDPISFSSVIKNPFLPIASFPEKSFLPQSPLLSRAKAFGKSDSATAQEVPTTSGSGDEQVAKTSKPGAIGLFRAATVDNSSQSSISGWIARSAKGAEDSRRQSLDTLWSGPATERVKELLSHGMMMLNISSLTERRGSDPKSGHVDDKVDTEGNQEGRSTPVTKKVPSPLEKSLVYLNVEEDSLSDSESLASVEMLTDEQISSLMLDQEIQDACEEVLGTPISEISPLIQELKQRELEEQEQPDNKLPS
ncbi:uncharacterized protein LOC134528243 [Bacillus rossius redtenbacheri]|uniref:uncharacterized protein LOC134528243 n=1 Tax=Bacillus rossius redtenbacheri TaxID=93214 RepID=UPI002FDCA453